MKITKFDKLALIIGGPIILVIIPILLIFINGNNQYDKAKRYYEYGTIYSESKDYLKAAIKYSEALTELNHINGFYKSVNKGIIDKAYGTFYFERAISYILDNNPQASCNDLDLALKYGEEKAQLLINKHCSWFGESIDPDEQ